MSSWHGCARALDGPEKESLGYRSKPEIRLSHYLLRNANDCAGGPCRRCAHRLRQKPRAIALVLHEPEPNLRQAEWKVAFGRALYQRGEAAAFIAFCWLVPTPPGGVELK